MIIAAKIQHFCEIIAEFPKKYPFVSVCQRTIYPCEPLSGLHIIIYTRAVGGYSAFTLVHPVGMPLSLLVVQAVEAGVVRVPVALTSVSQ